MIISPLVALAGLAVLHASQSEARPQDYYSNHESHAFESFTDGFDDDDEYEVNVELAEGRIPYEQPHYSNSGIEAYEAAYRRVLLGESVPDHAVAQMVNPAPQLDQRFGFPMDTPRERQVYEQMAKAMSGRVNPWISSPHVSGERAVLLNQGRPMVPRPMF